MRNASPLKPRTRSTRRPAEIAGWLEERDRWFSQLDPSQQFQSLFDHIPGVYFFAKNEVGRLMFASKGLLDRYQMNDETDILGRTDFDLNPDVMAECYVADDQAILAGKSEVIERLELWWDRQGLPDWFLVTKLPLPGRDRRVCGVMGILRRPDSTELSLPLVQTVSKAVEMIRRTYRSDIRIADVARACGQSLRQVQRHFQAAFGISPQEFLIKTRVLAAVRLLEESELSAAEIAHRCGFADASSFTQQFRARVGVTPASYRNQR
jgi:AraC-like DNA-binding protein